MSNTKTCYIIGRIGKPESKEREWADFVRDKIIEPAVVDCGYAKPSRADDPDTDVILMEIISQMFNADLVVADLTGHNGNVYYELGIRHCAQKAAIHLIQEEQKPLWDLCVYGFEGYSKVEELVLWNTQTFQNATNQGFFLVVEG